MAKRFFSLNLIESKKIFLVGSSEVGRLNATNIQNNIEEEGHEYDVLNLAYAGDRPLKRLKSVDDIISEKPKIIIYGIGFRDFEKPPQKNNVITNIQTNNQPKNLLPDPNNLFNKFLDSKMKEFGLEGINPKLVSLKLMDAILGNKEIEKPDIKSDTPFFIYGEHQYTVKEFLKLKFSFDVIKPVFNGYVPIERNQHFIGLEKIISKFQDNNIKVILFTTPTFRLMLDNVPSSDKELFFSMIDILEENHNVEVYFLHDKYSDLKMWNDIHHIAVNNEITIFNDDISEIILKEIDK